MDEHEEKRTPVTPAQWTVIALAVAFLAGAMLYRYLFRHDLWQSSAMFLGVPTVLAILLALTPQSKTVTGGILKGITLALLLVAPMVGEGYLCILFASPLFYLVGAVVGATVDHVRRKRGVTLSCVALVLLPMCLEGVVPGWSWNRKETVEATRMMPVRAGAVETALGESPRNLPDLPGFLGIGFPRALEERGEGLQIGAERVIHFAGAEGDPPGDLRMRVAERGPGYVRFETVSDGSKLTQWIWWRESEVTWQAVDAEHTRVTWRIGFERRLDPAWYFGAWERVAVRDAAQYLIEANATPAGER